VQLSAADQVRNLLGRYCRLIDAGDFAGLGALMDRASLQSEDGTEIARGGAAVADMYRGLVKVNAAGSPGTHHVVTNTEFAFEDDGTITAHSAYVVLQATDDLPLQPVIAGRYVDRFAEDPDSSWHFAQRRFSIGLTGELSRHMRISVP
jgi:3-phenylpropionate/cinnamic acid dioxygenase small subunit